MSDIDKPLSTTRGTDSNPDPITGAPGAHPVGVGVGAAGAGAAGAAIGAIGGPVGAVVGAAIGAVVGGLAGKGVAESIDPTAEDSHWQANHASQSYGSQGGYDQYRSAYRTGYEGVGRHGLDKGYSDVEDDLKSSYEKAKTETEVGWEHAKHATRAAYDRVRDNLRTT